MKRPMRYYELHAVVCKTFGHPKRLLIISTLREGEIMVSDLSEQTEIDSSNLSQHLHILRDKGQVKARRDDTKIYYSLSHPNIGKALDPMSAFLDQRIADSHQILSQHSD